MANQKSPYLAYTNDNPTRLGNKGFGSGGDDGSGGDMEARVKTLENRFERIDAKLDAITQDLGSLRVDSAYMKGKIEGMPSAAAFGELKGRVDSLPTTAKSAGLLGIAVAAITIFNNWEKISAAIFGP